MSHLHLHPGDSSVRLLLLRELHSEPLVCQNEPDTSLFQACGALQTTWWALQGAFEDTGPQLPVQISEQQLG